MLELEQKLLQDEACWSHMEQIREHRGQVHVQGWDTRIPGHRGAAFQPGSEFVSAQRWRRRLGWPVNEVQEKGSRRRIQT